MAYYNGVTELTAFPTQELVIRLDLTSYANIVNTRVRFSKLFKRGGNGQATDYQEFLYSHNSTGGFHTHTGVSATTSYETDYDGYNLSFPSVSYLDWDVNHLDTWLSLELRNTGDGVINIAPTRIIPDLISNSSYHLSGCAKVYPFSVYNTPAQIEGDDRWDFYLSGTGVLSSTLAWSNSGLIHKQRVRNNQFYQFGVGNTYANGSIGEKLAGFGLTIKSNFGGTEVDLNLIPDKLDINSLFCKDNDTEYCGTTAVTGIIDYDTGDWNIQFNCSGVSVDYSYITASYVKVLEQDLGDTLPSSSTLLTNSIASQNFVLSTSEPIYLYPIEFFFTSGDVNEYFGFGIEFDPYASVSGSNSNVVSATPLMRDRYRKVQLNLTDASKYKLVEGSPQGALLKDSFQTVFQVDQWIDGSNYPFTISGAGNVFDNFSYSLVVSSINGLSSEYVLEFATNSADALLTLIPVFSSEDETQYTLNVYSDLELSYYDDFVFDVEPDDIGIVFEDCNGNSITQLATYDYGAVSCIDISNLGLGTTNILMSATGYGITGQYSISSSIPTSSYDFGFNVAKDTECLKYSSSFYASCWFEKNDINYPPPYSNSICWYLSAEHAGNPYTNYSLTALNRNGDRVSLDSCLPAYKNDKLNLNIRLNETSVYDPKTVIFRLYPLYVESGYQVSADPIQFSVQEFPSFNSYFTVLSGTTELADSEETSNYPLLTGSHQLIFQINDDLLFNYSLSNVSWDINDTIYNDVSSVTATLSSVSATTICATLSINDVSLGNWFDTICFSDTICFNLIGSTFLDFIAFPTNRFSGSSLLKLNWANYTNTITNTAYDNGHVETFWISADPGYDKYIFKIGNYSVEQTTTALTSATNCRTTIPVDSSLYNIGDNINIYVSAFDYDVSNTVPFIAQSNNANKYRDDIVFIDYPTFTNISYIDDNVLNLGEINDGLFTLTCSFSSIDSPVKISDNSIITLALSSSTEYKSQTFNISENNTNKYFEFSTSINSWFRIKRNTFNTFNLILSGDLFLRIPQLPDANVKVENTNVVTIPLTVYDGPYLNIYTENPCVSANEIVTFDNITPTFSGLGALSGYSHFTFSDGNGHIMSASTVTQDFTGLYTEEGSYTPSLTGIYNSNPIIKNFSNYIIVGCGSNCSEFDASIDRMFPEIFTLPWTLEDVKLQPNERLTHYEFNDSVTKMFDNIDYLISKCKIYSFTAPSELLRTTFFEDIGYGIVDFRIRNDLFYCIVGNSIKIIDATEVRNELLEYEERITTLVSSPKITDVEIFENPIALEVGSDGSYFVVIDNTKKSIFVFDYIAPNKWKLKTYWGGPGSRSSRTKFSNPIDLTIDGVGNLYVADKDAKIVKVYNKYYNWIRNIYHDDFIINKYSPISISSDSSNNIYVLVTSEDDLKKYIYKFDSYGAFDLKFEVDINASKVTCHKAQESIIYVTSGSTIIKYIKTGFKINKFIQPKLEEGDYLIGLDEYNGNMVLLSRNYVFDIYDCLEIQDLRDSSTDDIMWDIESVKMDKNEFIQDWNFNDSFVKISQNLEIFRRSVKSKFITYPDYNDSSLIRHSMVSLSASEYPDQLTCPRIGVNEFVTYEVLNRQFTCLYEQLEILLEFISSRPASNDCDSTFCWRWDKLTTNNLSFPANCDKKPVSWVELKYLGITNWHQLTCEECEESLYEYYDFVLSAVGNKVPYKIEDCDFDAK